jgi:hypothetical protein
MGVVARRSGNHLAHVRTPNEGATVYIGLGTLILIIILLILIF